MYTSLPQLHTPVFLAGLFDLWWNEEGGATVLMLDDRYLYKTLKLCILSHRRECTIISGFEIFLVSVSRYLSQ